jgi:hypothetical protein
MQMANRIAVMCSIVLILVGWRVQVEAAPVPLHSEVGMEAVIDFYGVGIDTSDVKVESQGGTLDTIAVAVSIALGDGVAASASCSGSVEASWVSVNAGTVYIEAGLEETGLSDGVSIYVAGACTPVPYTDGVPPVWVYQFVADTDGEFRLSYLSSHVNMPTDDWETFRLHFNGQIAVIPARGAGAVSFAFSEGDTCVVSLRNDAMNLAGVGEQFELWEAVSCSWDFDTATLGTQPSTWGSIKAQFK